MQKRIKGARSARRKEILRLSPEARLQANNFIGIMGMVLGSLQVAADVRNQFVKKQPDTIDVEAEVTTVKNNQ